MPQKTKIPEEQKNIVTSKERKIVIEALEGPVNFSEAKKTPAREVVEQKVEAPKQKNQERVLVEAKPTIRKPAQRRIPNEKKGVANAATHDRFWLKTIPFFVIIIVLAAVVGINLGLYQAGWLKPYAEPFAQAIKYPIVFVGTSVVTYDEYADERESYASLSTLDNPGFLNDSDEDFSVVVTKLIRDTALEQGYSAYEITLTQEDIETAFYSIFGALPDSATANALAQQYVGTTSDVLIANLLTPYLKKQKLSEALRTDEVKLQNIQADARKLDDDIAGSAASFASHKAVSGQSYTAESLGFYDTDNLPDEFEAIRDLEKDAISEVIESSVGFHIVHVIDVIQSTETNKKYVQLEQIVFEKADVNSWLIDQLRGMRILELIPGYTWDSVCLQLVRTGDSCIEQQSDAYDDTINADGINLESLLDASQGSSIQLVP